MSKVPLRPPLFWAAVPIRPALFNLGVSLHAFRCLLDWGVCTERDPSVFNETPILTETELALLDTASTLL